MKLEWDLSQFYASQAEYDAAFAEYEKLCEQELLFKGKLGTKDGLLEYFKFSDKKSNIFEKLYVFSMLSEDLDASDAKVIEQKAKLTALEHKYDLLTLFVSQELKKIPSKTLMEYSKLPEFANYNLLLKHMAQNKKHILSAPQEKLLTEVGDAIDTNKLYNTLDSVEIKYGKVKDEDGKLVQMTHGNRIKLCTSHIKRVRKSAYKASMEPYKKLNQTIAVNYISHLKWNKVYATTSRYKNTLDMCTKSSYLPDNLPRKVVKNINEFLPLAHRYYAWRKKFMKLDKMENVDCTCNLFDQNVSPKIPLKEGIELVQKALAPLGKDYTDMLKTAVSEKWIDATERENKRSGAYSMGIYAIHPFILMTYDETQDSVSTLAHEFGHSMHSYYSNKTQPYAKADYDIFVAEIASTVNEVLLAKYNIDHAKTVEQKIDCLSELVNHFISTAYTQSLYTEFELFVHDTVNNEQPLTYKMLNDFYYNASKKYFGSGVHVLPEMQYHWSRIPHFYSCFYVYKYTTGFIAACAIAQKLLQDPSYKDVYKTKFLSAGCSKEPCDILKDVGVDILSKDTYAAAFSLMESCITQLENLTK